MSNFIRGTIVNNTEAEALKEMIFKRARERAEALDENVKENYTTAIKDDIMEIARDTFTKERNPFSYSKVEQSNEIVTQNEQKQYEGLGFSAKTHVNLNVENSTRVANKEFAQKHVEATMNSAREEFNNKKSFIGALNFLNSQATVSLFKDKDNSFNMLA